MKIIMALLLTLFMTTTYAVDYDLLVKEQVENIANMYSDGFSKLDDKSIRSRVLIKRSNGLCFIVASFNMQGYFNVENTSQFITLLACSRNVKSTPDKEMYVSGVFPFLSPKYFLDLDTIQHQKRSIKIFSNNKLSSVLLKRMRPRWWSVIEVNGLTNL